MSESNITALPLPAILSRLGGGLSKALVIRSGPESMVREIIARLEELRPGIGISHYCHRGEEIAGYRNIIYPHEGYFRYERADMKLLRSMEFDLVVIAYATTRRLHPDYHELDMIAAGTGASAVMAYYWDSTALLLDSEFIERKVSQVVNPYLERKMTAIREICEFTGQDPLTVEELCNSANSRAHTLWEERNPNTDEEIRNFYSESDFYIYSLMKECDWRGARAYLLGPLEAEIEPGSRVLDYGGGCGTLSLGLAEHGARASHLDLPGRLLDFAASRFRRRAARVDVIAARNDYPIEETYQAIISTHVIEHLPRPERTIRHMAARLERGGRLMLSIPFDPNPVAGKHPGLHLNRLTPCRYSELMDELGFWLEKRIEDLDIFRLAG